MTKKTLLQTNIGLLLFTGIPAFISYVFYAALGHYLWPEYNRLTQDISSLGAEGAPNQEKLFPFITAYAVFLFIFVTVYVFASFYRNRTWGVKIGSILLLLMSVISKYGYSMFPLEGDKTQMTFQNMMHIVTTVLVVFLSIGALFSIAFGYRKRAESKRFGTFVLFSAIVFTLLGMTNPIGMGAGLNLLGLTERLAIYSLHLIIAVLGIWEAKSLLAGRKST